MRVCTLCVLLRLATAVVADGSGPAGRTFDGIFYPIHSLGYALETNYWARTNAILNYHPETDQPWTGYQRSSTNVAKYRLNTTSVMYGKRGATAISVAQFGSTENRLCLITRRHAVGAGHYGGVANGQIVYFIGTNGLLHGMVTSNTWIEPVHVSGSVMPGFENWAIVTFTKDVPSDVEPMKLAGPLIAGREGSVFGLIEHLFPPMKGKHFPAVLFVCQHGYCGRLTQPHPEGIIGMDGGDSGSPGFILLGDECVNIGGVSMGYPTTNMLYRVNYLTRRLGLNTNDYQPHFVSLTNYPAWPY